MKEDVNIVQLLTVLGDAFEESGRLNAAKFVRVLAAEPPDLWDAWFWRAMYIFSWRSKQFEAAKAAASRLHFL